jgi:hypothetical protein
MNTVKTSFGNQTAKLLWFALGAVLILGAELGITQTQAFMRNGNLLAVAMTIDVCFGIPVLYWLLVVRPRQLDPITVLPIFVLSVIVAQFLIPNDYHASFRFVEYGVVCSELALVVYGGIKIRRIAAEFRHLQSTRNDFLLNLRRSLEITLMGGKENTALSILASEIAMVRYAFAWRSKKEVLEGKQSFSTHKKSQYSAIFFTLLAVCIVEAVGVHILVALFWNATAALVLTALSAYTVLFLVADFRAIVQRPFILEDRYLLVRTGIRWTAEIPFEAISDVRLAPKRLDDNIIRRMKRITPFGAPNVLLEFSTKQEVRGLYGIKREEILLGCSVDNAEEFVRLVQEKGLTITQKYRSPEA